MNTDLKTRLNPIFRRSSSSSSASSSTTHPHPFLIPPKDRSWSRETVHPDRTTQPASTSRISASSAQGIRCPPITPSHQKFPSVDQASEQSDTDPASFDDSDTQFKTPKVVLERPTPERGRSSEVTESISPAEGDGARTQFAVSVKRIVRPTIAIRRHSPIPDGNSRLFSALQQTQEPFHRPPSYTNFSSESLVTSSMTRRKVWVKRPGSSATQVAIGEDDLVDDVRDMVMKKYSNSLGRSFDSPDVTLHLVQRKYSARHSNHERLLGPEEIISKLLDVYYPGGQTIEEALVIDVPQRRTPKHSPRMAVPYYMTDSLRPGENGSDYFPPMNSAAPHSPQMVTSLSASSNSRPVAHSISVLETGQLPDLPSPGSRMTRHSHRPKTTRNHTTSPTVLSGAVNPPPHGTLCLWVQTYDFNLC